ncbi:C1GALT1-specific chaperone 1-like protein [Onthophagus taurus]|uniref:C1GALT1-specific chaperone 1-like protein n=1 Tax=Onthophagus taurus TaxID=166361 RepID=UPI000C207B4E|nr:C1GALT1-specific chaperone 1-like protein [Onthophagus taurus]
MYHFFARILFVVGVILGMFLATITVILTNKYQTPSKISELTKFPNNFNYNKWLLNNGMQTEKVQMDAIRYKNHNYLLESEFLYDKVKVLCIILVRNMRNAEAAKATWAQSCNDVKLINLKVDKKKILISMKKNKQSSTWRLLCNNLLNVSNTFDWIFVVNDNTFGIVENLRLLVAPLDKLKGYYLGHAVNFWGLNYNIGLAGYAINNATLNALKNKLLKNNDSCTTEITFMNKEDFYLGKILSSLNIFPEDTRDSLGLTTFHSYNLQQEFFVDLNYYKTSIYPVECCSSESITFQAIEADKMYMYHYLIYRLQVFTAGHLGNKTPSTNVPKDKVWKTFLKERGIPADNVSAQQYYKIWEDIVHDPSEFVKEMRQLKYDYK